MLEEIRKRPFVRPLFYWITGIVLQVCFPLQRLSCLLLLPVIIVVVISLFTSNKKPDFIYNSRWILGMVLCLLFIFLSIQFTALSEQRLKIPAQSGYLKKQALLVQEQMVGKLDNLDLTDNEKSILATITVNYRKAMNRELRNKFSATGVAHLLSVSGFHVGIVAAILSLLFSVLPGRLFFRWIRFILILLLVWVFAFIAGLSSASVRAAIMFTIYMIGREFQYRPDRYNTLAATAFCMLVYNPFYLFDIGFQLSFIAVYFILFLQPRIYNLFELRNPLVATPWGVLSVTLAAQIGTVFLCCYYFGEVSTVFLFTNLFLSLLATLLIPLTLCYMLLPAGTPCIEWLQSLIELLTNGMMWIVEQFSHLPGATLIMRFDFFTMLSGYLILALIMYYIYSRRFWAIFTALLFLLIILFRQVILQH